MTLLSGKRLIRKMTNTKFNLGSIYPAPITYQFSNVVVGKNKLCQAGQSLLKVFTNATKEEQNQRFSLGQKLNGEKTHRNMITKRIPM